MKKLSIILLLPVLLLAASCNSGNENKSSSTPDSASYVKKAALANISQLPNSQVCMVNNKLMNKEQTAVEVNGKTYYGCCTGCEATLKNDSASRIAIDPLTGAQVDKASAYIFLKPGSKDDVLYFSSAANAIKYCSLSKPQ